MKYVIAGALAMGLLSNAAMAQSVEFRGSLCLTAVSATCPGSGWVVGDCLLMRFSPPGLGTNGVTTEMSLMGQSFGDNYSLPSGTLVGTLFKLVDAYHIGRTGYKYAATMRITKQTPSTILATSPAVSLVGGLTNFSNSPNCTVAFRASATLRP